MIVDAYAPGHALLANDPQLALRIPNVFYRSELEWPGGQSGQSGHFLSPQFADQQASWLLGAPTPFLAGATVWRIELLPAR